jgi:hypothetical protein
MLKGVSLIAGKKLYKIQSRNANGMVGFPLLLAAISLVTPQDMDSNKRENKIRPERVRKMRGFFFGIFIRGKKPIVAKFFVCVRIMMGSVLKQVENK